MLQLAQRTSAPRACSVSISTAVWIVMCSEPVMRAPRSGCPAANSSRIAIRPGISVSAMRISLRPQSASDRSATTKSFAVLVVDLSTALISRPPFEKEVGERRCCNRRGAGFPEPGGRIGGCAPSQRSSEEGGFYPKRVALATFLRETDARAGNEDAGARPASSLQFYLAVR